MAAARRSGAAATCWHACTAWCSLPAAWVGVAVLVAVGCLLGSLQVAVALVVFIFSPILRRCMLALVRHVYPTEAGRIHVWSLLWLRRWWLRDRRHARPLTNRLKTALQRRRKVGGVRRRTAVLHTHCRWFTGQLQLYPGGSNLGRCPEVLYRRPGRRRRRPRGPS